MFQHGIHADKQLAHAGDERHFGGLAVRATEV